MSALNILIVGAGVAGPALAILLQRSNPAHTITVVERWPTLRAGGQQIDLKTEGLKIVSRMGLLDAMRARCVDETGMEFFDLRGRSLGVFGVNPAGGDPHRRALTNEYEIMRGDMVRVLYDASLAQDAERRGRPSSTAAGAGGAGGGLTYEFGTTVTELAQVDDGVDVTLSGGAGGRAPCRRRFDLVVAADGLGSRTRRLAFGSEASDAAFRSIGVHAAFYDVPRVEGEDDPGLAAAYHAPGRRMVLTRTAGRPRTQVLLFTTADGSGALRRSHGAGAAEQRRAFAEAFGGAGWRTRRLVDGMAAAEDFYACELGQVRMGDRGLSRGRVVLLGDAGYCPSPFTGMGTETCLVGAYVLAGELARRGPGVGVDEALRAYEEVVRPAVERMQHLPGLVSWAFPSSRWGVWIMNQLVWLAAKIDKMMYRRAQAAGAVANAPVKKQLDVKMGYGLPEYPELNLESAV